MTSMRRRADHAIRALLRDYGLPSAWRPDILRAVFADSAPTDDAALAVAIHRETKARATSAPEAVGGVFGFLWLLWLGWVWEPLTSTHYPYSRCEACNRRGTYREDHDAFLCDTHAELPGYAALADPRGRR